MKGNSTISRIIEVKKAVILKGRSVVLTKLLSYKMRHWKIYNEILKILRKNMNLEFSSMLQSEARPV